MKKLILLAVLLLTGCATASTQLTQTELALAQALGVVIAGQGSVAGTVTTACAAAATLLPTNTASPCLAPVPTDPAAQAAQVQACTLYVVETGVIFRLQSKFCGGVTTPTPTPVSVTVTK